MSENTNITQESKKRILYIDLIRAYAILMMVQGHVVDLTLSPIFRDSSYILYTIWNFLRGTTAPIFFFSSGTIFSYLFLRAQGQGKETERFKKSIKRGLLLVFIGYLLQFKLEAWFALPPNWVEYPYVFAVNVLHSIGAGMIVLASVLYLLKKMPHRVSLTLMVFLGAGVFLLWPELENSQFIDQLAVPVKSYLVRTQGGFFPVIPWIGFMFFGAGLGVLLHFKDTIYRNYIFILTSMSIGFILHFFSGDLLELSYNLTGWDNLHYLLYNNFLFFRLGHVFIFVGIFSLISFADQHIPKLVFTIGRNTLLIYIIHVFLVYNTGFTHGFATKFVRSLEPLNALMLALAIELVIIFAIWLLEKLNTKYGKTIIKLK